MRRRDVHVASGGDEFDFDHPSIRSIAHATVSLPLLRCTMNRMRIVLLGDPPAEFQAVLDRRRQLGLDVYDEVWDGDHHLPPAGSIRHGALQMTIGRLLYPTAAAAGMRITGPINIGTPGDYRVPDAAVVAGTAGTWASTAHLVVEIVSPGDETYAKLGFYSAHRVAEVVVVDPGTSRVELYRLTPGETRYVYAEHSALLGLTAAEVAADLDLA